MSSKDHIPSQSQLDPESPFLDEFFTKGISREKNHNILTLEEENSLFETSSDGIAELIEPELYGDEGAEWEERGFENDYEVPGETLEENVELHDENALEELDTEELSATPAAAPKCYNILSNKRLTPSIGFEFDVNYGISSVCPPFEPADAGFAASVYAFEGKNVTTHRIKADGFRLEGDGNRIEIATKPLELNQQGRDELQKVMKDVLALVADLKKQCANAKPDRSRSLPASVGVPRHFKPSMLDGGVQCIFPLAFSRKESYFGKGCAMGASPQATFTLPLSKVDELVTLIKNSEAKKVAGRALSGPSGYRQGVRSQALYDAQKAVNESLLRHIKAATSLSGGDRVTSANFSASLQGLLILMVSYLRTGEIRYDSRDYEVFAKAYLPLNVKNPFCLLYADLTTAEKKVFKELYDNPRTNMWKLAKPAATASDSGNQLFPDSVRGHQECWFNPVPTWNDFVEKTVNNIPLIRNEFCAGTEKKGEDRGCEVLFAPLSRIIPYEKGSRRVTVEMRRLGFNWVLSHGYEKDGIKHPGWLEMTTSLFDMASQLNR